MLNWNTAIRKIMRTVTIIIVIAVLMIFPTQMILPFPYGLGMALFLIILIIVLAIIRSKSSKIQVGSQTDDTMFFGCPRCGRNTEIVSGRQYCTACNLYL